MNRQFRAAVPDDADRIAQIHRAARAAAMPWLPVIHSEAEDRWFYRHIVIPDHDVEVCVDDGQIMGFVAITDKWLHHLYVDPTTQGGGIGTALLEKAMAKRPELNLWVFQQNTPARAFYAAHGFVDVELTDGQANEEKTPDVHMRWERRKSPR